MKRRKKAKQKCQIDTYEFEGHGRVVIVRGTKDMQDRRNKETRAAMDLADARCKRDLGGVNRATISLESAMPVPKVHRLDKKGKKSWKPPVLTPLEKVAHGRARMEMIQKTTEAIRKREIEDGFDRYGRSIPKVNRIDPASPADLRDDINDELLAAVLLPEKIKPRVVKEFEAAKKFIAQKRQVRKAYGKVIPRKTSEPIWLPSSWASYC